MAAGNFVSYLRVSTGRQGQSGLGIEAQRAAVTEYLNGGNWQVIKEFVEVESGSRNDRPELAKAMSLCRLRNATLVIAKIDRLSRDAHFLLGLQKSGVRFVAADMPEANEMVVGIMAVVAQAERKMISVRTKSALAAAKARGVKLGGVRTAKVTEPRLPLTQRQWPLAGPPGARKPLTALPTCARLSRTFRRLEPILLANVG